MKYGLVRTMILMIALAAGSVEFAKSIINTFSFDIFGGCVDGTYAPTDVICEYGPQMSINVLATLFFFGASYALLNPDLKNVSRRITLKIAAFSGLFLALLTLVWRIQISLQDNFILFAGPQSLTEYLYVGFVWVDVVLIGILLGLLWWLPTQINLKSIDAAKRKEPQQTFKK